MKPVQLWFAVGKSGGLSDNAGQRILNTLQFVQMDFRIEYSTQLQQSTLLLTRALARTLVASKLRSFGHGEYQG